MNAVDLGRELHEYIETASEDVLNVIYEIFRASEDHTDFKISDDHKRILDERLKDYYANPMNVITWEEMKERFKKRENNKSTWQAY